MNISILKGKGRFTNNEGFEVEYPICKLVITNSKGDSIEQKLDKINKKLIGYLFNEENSNQIVQDEQGNQLQLYYLKERNIDNNNFLD